MKVMMIFDQTQAGLGGKESPDLPMGGKPMAIGSCGMFQRFMDQNDGKVIATLWCGDGTFKEDPEKNAKKFAAMAKKYKDNDKIVETMKANEAEIKSEVLAEEVVYGETDGYVKEWNINKEHVALGVTKL